MITAEQYAREAGANFEIAVPLTNEQRKLLEAYLAVAWQDGHLHGIHTYLWPHGCQQHYTLESVKDEPKAIDVEEFLAEALKR